MVGKTESEIDLSNLFGGVSLNSSYSDLFVVGFDDTLTIKQEDSISHNLNGIVIQPSNDKVTINIDQSVDLEKRKLKLKITSQYQSPLYQIIKILIKVN